MTKFTLAAAAVFAFLSTAAIAQEQVDVASLNAAIETQRQITETQRQLIVDQNLTLTAAESEHFWPLYREYRADVAKLNDRFVKLVQRYAKQFETLGDQEAMDLLNDSLSIESDRIKLAKKYSKKFAKFMPGNKVARFMQIESRLDAILNLKVKNSIPLAM